MSNGSDNSGPSLQELKELIINTHKDTRAEMRDKFSDLSEEIETAKGDSNSRIDTLKKLIEGNKDLIEVKSENNTAQFKNMNEKIDGFKGQYTSVNDWKKKVRYSINKWKEVERDVYEIFSNKSNVRTLEKILKPKSDSINKYVDKLPPYIG
ncbi:MAG: hypothetical protein U9N35_01170 [Euryarchaeota archaeon]|nr:hypothetical protein [Euryarchaeota archaeon]